MDYVVEVCYGERSEWSDKMEYYGDALNYALAMSEMQKVTQTKVWFGEEVVDTCTDGIIDNIEEEYWEEDEEEEDEWEEYEEPNYPFDEWGYDPYTGGFDPDL
jgi:hypothetical protein